MEETVDLLATAKAVQKGRAAGIIRTGRRLGNLRYGRFGNLRYIRRLGDRLAFSLTRIDLKACATTAGWANPVVTRLAPTRAS